MLILGIADIVSALFLIRGVYNWNVPGDIITIFAAYLIIKAVIFIFDITSLFDLFAGVILLLSISNPIPLPLLYIFAGFLGLKGVMTLLAKT